MKDGFFCICINFCCRPPLQILNICIKLVERFQTCRKSTKFGPLATYTVNFLNQCINYSICPGSEDTVPIFVIFFAGINRIKSIFSVLCPYCF